MTNQELESAVRMLARAVLQLSDEVASTWYEDGERMLTTGVTLEDKQEITRLAIEPEPRK